MHQNRNLNARPELFGQLCQILQLPQKDLGIAPLPSPGANNLQALLLNRRRGQFLLLQLSLGLGLLIGQGGSLEGFGLGLLAPLGAALFVLDNLFLDLDSALEPASTALELSGFTGIRVTVRVAVR